MTDLEQELREHLAAQASRTRVGRENWDDLNRRIGRRRRNQRGLLVGACAALLVAMPVLGLAIARTSDGSGAKTGSVQSGSGASVTRPAATSATTGQARECTTTTRPLPSDPTTTLAPGSDTSTGCPPSEAPLPRAGIQPADRAEARAAVETAFAHAYDGGLASTTASRDAIQDGPSLAPVADQVGPGPFQSLMAHSSVAVRDVVFTSPTRAAVRFDSYVEANVPGRMGTIGQAVLVDSRWLVAHDTACVDLRLVGALCPGFQPLAHNG